MLQVCERVGTSAIRENWFCDLSPGFIPREAPSREVYNLVAREAGVDHTSMARPA